MTATKIQLGNPDEPAQVWARTAELTDQARLRSWRNANRQRFHDPGIVTAENQQTWFSGYLERPEDFMFIVHCAEQPIGCIGIRLQAARWDLYNAIRGEVPPASKGFMSQALNHIIGFALRRYEAPLGLEVLADNPALSWYQRNGFTIMSQTTLFFELAYTGPIPAAASVSA